MSHFSCSDKLLVYSIRVGDTVILITIRLGSRTLNRDQESTWKLIVTYIVLAPYLGVIIYVLLRYIFLAQEVTRDVLYAATAVYVLLGAFFVPIYGLLETLQPGAFIDSNSDLPIQWQQFIYYSHTPRP